MTSNNKRLQKPRHILELTPQEKVEFVESIDLVISDIDGVLWNVASNIVGASDGFKVLKKAGKPFYFITNNSVRTKEEYDKLFKAANLDVDYSDLIHPAKSIVKYLINNKFDGLIYCIGTEQFKGFFRKAGFKLIDGPTKIFNESFSDLFKSIFDREPVRAVIIDVDFNLSGAKLIRAQQYLKHPDCILIAAATDMMLPITKDLQIIGPGPYVKVLTEASGKPAITLGKPGKELIDLMADSLHIKERKRTLMIGDMLEQDVGFGKSAGMTTLLVLSGGSSKEQLIKNTNPHETPDYYADSMADFVKFFDTSKL